MEESEIQILRKFVELELGAYFEPGEISVRNDAENKDALINNGVVDYDESSSYDIYDALHFMSNFHCEGIQLRFYCDKSYSYLEGLLEWVENQRSLIKTIQLLVPESSVLSSGECLDLLRKFKRVSLISLTKSVQKTTVVNEQQFLRQIPYEILGCNQCGVIRPESFVVNTRFRSETKGCNTCLSGKIAVDVNGLIKSCPSMKISYGDIRTFAGQKYELKFPAIYQKYMKIHKDEVDVCRDCEYRRVCIDCRAYTIDGEKYGKPAKCSYDPYTGSWSQL